MKKVVNKTASYNNSDKHDLIGFAAVTMNVTQFNMEYMNELFRNHKHTPPLGLYEFNKNVLQIYKV